MIEKLIEGAETCINPEELEQKLKTKKILKVKYGADPSRPDLHLGHYVCLRKLKDFQEQGHRIIFIIGDFTAIIGDPSGQNKTRPRLTEEEVKENSKTYMDQVFKVLDPERTEIVFNSQWLSKLSSKDVIELSARYTVARMLERDDFKVRFNSRIPISVHELLYPIFQAYDSLYLKIDVEIGGSDQHFNFALTREVQRSFGQEPQVFITMPLIEGIDGKLKMSKSYDNAIGLTESADEMFGKIMSIPDELISKYYKVILRKWNKKLEKFVKENPRDAKENLAIEITKIFYGLKVAINARDNFVKIFKEKSIPDHVSVYKTVSGRFLVEIMFEAGLVPSKSEARRLITQSAVKFENETVKDINYTISRKGILKVGKRKFLKIETE